MSSTLSTYGTARLLGANDHQITSYAAVDTARSLQSLEETLRLQGAMQMHFLDRMAGSQDTGNRIASLAHQSQRQHGDWMQNFQFLKESGENTRILKLSAIIPSKEIQKIASTLAQEIKSEFSDKFTPISTDEIAELHSKVGFYESIISLLEQDGVANLSYGATEVKAFVSRLFSDCLVTSLWNGSRLKISDDRLKRELLNLRERVNNMKTNIAAQARSAEQLLLVRRKFIADLLIIPKFKERCAKEFAALISKTQDQFPDSCRVNLDNITAAHTNDFVEQIGNIIDNQLNSTK